MKTMKVEEVPDTYKKY